jgi:2,3,4,5-tetrahydropyridine-2-carboxylate N-succinyltransferase
MALKLIGSEEEFKALIEETRWSKGYKEPVAFGIARVDRGQKHADKVLQATYAVVNWQENYGSAALFIKSLQEAGVEVDFSGSEFTVTVTDEFISNAMAGFAPYLSEASGDAHRNVQVIKTLAAMDDIGRDFRITFLFDDAAPQSEVQIKGYIQLATTSGNTPSNSDCDEDTEYGRMKVDEVNDLLYICTQSGWVSK